MNFYRLKKKSKKSKVYNRGPQTFTCEGHIPFLFLMGLGSFICFQKSTHNQITLTGFFTAIKEINNTLYCGGKSSYISNLVTLKNNLPPKNGWSNIFVMHCIWKKKKKSKCVSGIVHGAVPNVQADRIWPVGRSLRTTGLQQLVYKDYKLTMLVAGGVRTTVL